VHVDQRDQPALLTAEQSQGDEVIDDLPGEGVVRDGIGEQERLDQPVEIAGPGRTGPERDPGGGIGAVAGARGGERR
jgi:hypothetical protein